MQLENPLLGFEFYSPGPVENLYNYLYIFYLLQMLLDINVNAEADKSHTAECEHLLHTREFKNLFTALNTWLLTYSIGRRT